MSVDSLLKAKSMEFAKRIVSLYKYLCKEHREYVMSNQILRSGTSIGANITEAVYGSSRKDFVAKLQIARKEAAETIYWLELLHSSDYIPTNLFNSIISDCKDLISMLTSAIKTVQE